MTEFMTFIVTLAPSTLLIAGACVVAVWAARLPDEQSLVARLTGEAHRLDTGSPCGQKRRIVGETYVPS